MRCLVVDEQGIFRAYVCLILLREGWECITAASAEDAYRDLREGLLPDVVVVSDQMQAMSGSELIRHMKSDPRWAHIPAILVSVDSVSQVQLDLLNVPFLDKRRVDAALVGLLKEMVAST